MCRQKIECIKSIGIKWTANEEVIKELTGYGLGELYEAEKEKITPINYSSEECCIFDCSTFNFHLYPANEQEMKRIADEISDIRKKLLEELKNRSDVEVVKSKEFLNIQDNRKIYVADGIGSRGHIVPLRGDTRYGKTGANQLYRFITAKKNNRLYNLNFMRFFTDNDKKVNCILKAIQFDRCTGGSVNEDGICYPKSTIEEETEILKTHKEKKFHAEEFKEEFENGKSFCFDPCVSFHSEDDIATAFITFIDECDKQIKEN